MKYQYVLCSQELHMYTFARPVSYIGHSGTEPRASLGFTAFGMIKSRGRHNQGLHQDQGRFLQAHRERKGLSPNGYG